MRKTARSCCCGAALLLGLSLGGRAARAAEQDRYWEWGWGTYGSGLGGGASVADIARFDWTAMGPSYDETMTALVPIR